MVDNQHKKISGYRDLTEDEIAVMNDIKAHEEVIAVLFENVLGVENVDTRWASIAKTHFEQGFMALVRSVARPNSPFNYNNKPGR